MRDILSRRVFRWLLLGGLAAGCGSSTPAPGVDGGGPPSITITSPTANATGVLIGGDADMTVPIAFTLTNGQLGMTSGYHVHVHIGSGTDCNETGTSYNSQFFASPAGAQFRKCPEGMRTGSQTVQLTLHNADHTAVMNGAQEVAAQVTFTTAISTTQPSIQITSPAASATVGFSIPVAFTTTNFTLDPGTTCTPAPCGHVHLLVDGSDCNVSPNDYHAQSATSPITADIAQCPVHQGQHELTVELHNADHTPVKDSHQQTISDRVTVTVQ